MRSDRALALANRILACMCDAIVLGDRRNLSIPLPKQIFYRGKNLQLYYSAQGITSVS
jgi:hypothetical protein